MTARDAEYEQRKAEWIARQLDKAPPLNDQAKALIRTAFADLRRAEAA